MPFATVKRNYVDFVSSWEIVLKLKSTKCSKFMTQGPFAPKRNVCFDNFKCVFQMDAVNEFNFSWVLTICFMLERSKPKRTEFLVRSMSTYGIQHKSKMEFRSKNATKHEWHLKMVFWLKFNKWYSWLCLHLEWNLSENLQQFWNSRIWFQEARTRIETWKTMFFSLSFVWVYLVNCSFETNLTRWNGWRCSEWTFSVSL